MSRSILFTTHGLIDIRAFTTFGINSKPNSKSPIGFFGTGLKYAIAVLVREKLNVTVFIGETEYVFYTRQSDFRDKNFQFVMMKKRKGFLSKWTYTELPFTTELGKNWKIWQAFRELESNTRDEGGITELVEVTVTPLGGGSSRHEYKKPYGQPYITQILVEGEAFVNAYLDMDSTFLPNALVERSHSETVQVFNKPSKHLYYRGLRVMDLKLPSVYTYNILGPLELTEDRTVKYSFYADAYLENAIVTSNDPELIESILGLDNQKHYEGTLDFSASVTTPSDEFKARLSLRKKKGSLKHAGLFSYHDRYFVTAPLIETYDFKIPKSSLSVIHEFWSNVTDETLEYVLNIRESTSPEDIAILKFHRDDMIKQISDIGFPY